MDAFIINKKILKNIIKKNNFDIVVIKTNKLL